MLFSHLESLQNIFGVLLVFFASDVLKVVCSIVCPVAVLVVYLKIGNADECRSNKTMNLKPSVFSVYVQSDVLVAANLPLRARKPWPSSLAASNAFNVPKVRDRIVRRYFNRFPCLHALIVHEGAR